MQDKFPARVRKSGTSKVVVIPEPIRDKYQEGDTVYVTIEKEERKE